MSMFSDSVLGDGVSVFYDVGNPTVQAEMRALNKVARDTADERAADAVNTVLKEVPEVKFSTIRQIEQSF